MLLRFLVSSLLFIIIGCASPMSYITKAKQQISGQNWEVAYRFLEDGFLSGDVANHDEAISLFRAHPELKVAAISTFSVESLRNSIVRYQLKNSYDIESYRLDLFKSVANEFEYDAARANLYLVYDDAVRELSMAKKLAEKIEDEKRKMLMEAEQNAKKIEEEKIKKLIKAERESYYLCSDRNECDKAFAITQIFIVSNSDMKIQLANDTIIETYNPTESNKVGLKAVKMPKSGSSAQVMLFVNCHADTKSSIESCYDKKISVYSAFPGYISSNLVK